MDIGSRLLFSFEVYVHGHRAIVRTPEDCPRSACVKHDGRKGVHIMVMQRVSVSAVVNIHVFESSLQILVLVLQCNSMLFECQTFFLSLPVIEYAPS